MKNKKGSTIVWAITLIMVLVVIVGASLSFAYMSYNQSIRNRNKTQVEMIANSAIKSLVSAIEDKDNDIVPDKGEKKISKVELIDTNTNQLNTKYGTISDIYIKRKENNSQLAIARLTAHYLSEEYTIYAYLINSNNSWKCVQYDTNGNRNIKVEQSTDKDDKGSTDSGNTGDGGNEQPSTPTSSSILKKIENNVTRIMSAFYGNNQNLDSFNEWYQQECQKNNVNFEKVGYLGYLQESGNMNTIYQKLYNNGQTEKLENDLFEKVKQVNNDIQYNCVQGMYLHFNVIDKTNGNFIITGNGNDGNWNYIPTYILYIDNTLYVKKTGCLYTYNELTYSQIKELVLNTNEWQKIE